MNYLIKSTCRKDGITEYDQDMLELPPMESEQTAQAILDYIEGRFAWAVHQGWEVETDVTQVKQLNDRTSYN